MDVMEKLVEIVCDAMEADGCIGHCNHPPCFAVERVVNTLITHGVTVQERNGQGCPQCDIVKANEGVINTALWVKEPETNKWTMMGKRLKFCPNCGRRLPQPPKGE